MSGKIYESLYELTRRESGAIQYPSGEIWISIWSSDCGIPRQLISLYNTTIIWIPEPLTARRIAAPREVIRAMKNWCRAQGDPPQEKGYRAWLVNKEVTVVINLGWN